MIFGWIRVGSAPEKCRNRLIRDETGKQSPTTSYSLVKYIVSSSLLIVDSVRPSNNLKSILPGMRQ